MNRFSFQPLSWRDPRLFQIAVLSSLLTYGVVSLDFEVRTWLIPAVLATALLTQIVASVLVKIRIDPWSAVITSLSLLILLGLNDQIWLLLAAFVGIASKFVFRINGAHIFNPANFAICCFIYFADGWVSPGQWGQTTILAFTMICVGGMVVHKAMRSDVTLAFLFAYIGLVFGYAYWLDNPWSIPLHKVQNGALVLFAFFMISDPKTTPQHRAGRIFYGIFVAILTMVLQVEYFMSDALMWALVGSGLLVPLINWILPAERYQWGVTGQKTTPKKTKRQAKRSPQKNNQAQASPAN